MTLILSSSGRYLLVESAPIRREPYWAISRAFLLDTLTGEIKHSWELGITIVRANFGVLPSGDEVLFISAESYMSVQMVHCASGQCLHEYITRQSWDFCHTSYALSADATRLFTFGCIWACDSEFRLYDVTPWTMNGTPGESFPLPLVYKQEEVFGAEIVLPASPLRTQDGTFSCVALVTLEYLPERNSKEEAELLEDLSPIDREIFETFCQLPRSGMAILLRRISPMNGEVQGWLLRPIQKTEVTGVHILSDHRVMLLNDRVQILNGVSGELSDHGALVIPARYSLSATTSDGETLILRWVEDI